MPPLSRRWPKWPRRAFLKELARGGDLGYLLKFYSMCILHAIMYSSRDQTNCVFAFHLSTEIMMHLFNWLKLLCISVLFSRNVDQWKKILTLFLRYLRRACARKSKATEFCLTFARLPKIRSRFWALVSIPGKCLSSWPWGPFSQRQEWEGVKYDT